MTNFISYRDGGKSAESGVYNPYGSVFTPGVADIGVTTSWQVTQRGAGANMSVDVAVGSGNIYTSGLVAYPYWGFSDAVNNVTVSASNPSNPRKDIVVAYVDLSIVSSASNNNPGALKFLDVAGTAAGSPVDPSNSTIQSAVGAGNPWIKLARLSIAANASSVVNANITDLRQPVGWMGNLWGGSSNTVGHAIPNAADDTVVLLAAAQSPTNKTISGTTNKVRSGGANSSLVDSNTVKVDLEQMQTDYQVNYVASGCVWSPDAATSTLNGSMTSGVVHIAGRRLTVASVTAHAFTASKDTYIDLQDNGDGTATITYTAVSNGANSPNYANSGTTANTVRVAKIVSGGSALAAAATSVVQYGWDSIGQTVYNTNPLFGHVSYTPCRFSAYRNSAQNTGNSAFAIINFDTKNFDTGNNLDVTTNVGRFTAPIAGFYHFDAIASIVGNSIDFLSVLYKNGTAWSYGTRLSVSSTGGTNTGSSVSDTLQLALGDYVEIFTFCGSTHALDVGTGPQKTHISGFILP